MEHDWVRVSDCDRRQCFNCGLYAWYDVRTVPCKGIRYTDNDSLRPDVDERAKQELGHGLSNYDWSTWE